MTAIVERDVAPPSRWVPNYPIELERIVLTALARERVRRYPSALHLARALEEYALSAGVIPNHQALARYYQQVFREEERVARAHGSYRPTQVQGPTLHLSPHAAEPVGRPADALLNDLRALRAEPPREHALQEAPEAIHLPTEFEELIVDETPLILARPKR